MYIARQPILKSDLEVYGYELLYRDSKDSTCFNDIESLQATASVIESLYESGIENIVGKKVAFINFDQKILESGLIELLDKSKVVIEILESTVIDEQFLSRLTGLSNAGFKIALDDVVDDKRTAELVNYAHIVKVDLSLVKLDEIKPLISKLLSSGKILLAEKVETESEFIMAKAMGFQLYQGYFFSKPKIIGHKNDNKSALKTQYIRILNELKQEEPSYTKIAEIIQQDASLTYRFLRIIGKRAIEDEIASIKRAMTFMGLKELERWIHVLLIQDLGGNKPKELMIMSLTRSKFSEFLAIHSQQYKHSQEATLMGLLSMIDVLQDVSMEEALKGIPLSSEIISALVRNEGELSLILRIVKAIEIANWNEVDLLGNWLKLPIKEIGHFYLSALKWAEETVLQITS